MRFQNKVGTIAKDTSRGPFVDEWKKLFADQCKDVTQVDISTALSTYAFAVKDESELRAMRTASKACVALMTPYFLDEMSNILDAEKKVKHSVLADKVDKKLDDNQFWKTVELPSKGKLPSDLDPAQLDWILGPSIQSGGKYDLRFAGEPNDENLHAGIIIAAMGLRYKSYCSTIARTYLVDPNKAQELQASHPNSQHHHQGDPRWHDSKRGVRQGYQHYQEQEARDGEAFPQECWLGHWIGEQGSYSYSQCQEPEDSKGRHDPYHQHWFPRY
jgi:nucleosome binding factor SPN SPT16 subunit